MTCVYRSEHADADRINCASPSLMETELSRSFCEERCPFHRTEAAAEVKKPIRGAGDLIAAGLAAVGIEKKDGCGCGSRQAKLNRLIPFASSRIDPRWTVVVTTAPRQENTLTACVSSLRAAGWEPVIFAEPGSHRVDDAETITHKKRQGLWHNWLQSARWCLRHTNADFVLTVQDDVTFHPDSKAFTESILWPSARCGFVSLYTPKHYQLKSGEPDAWQPGVRRVRTSSLWGACALVWPRAVLQQVVKHPIAASWLGVLPDNSERLAIKEKRQADPSLVNNSDTAIGRIVKALGRQFWYVDPSPAQHIARVSTVNHGDNSGRRNCYRCADDSLPLVHQVPVPDTFRRFAA